jgi:phosphoribosylaminoimidazole carboxylase
MDSRTVGILGGGQLGRMMVESAHRLNLKTIILDKPESPAKRINALHEHVNGSFSKADDVRSLARQCDILTIEIEHVNTTVLEEIETHGVDGRKVQVQPSWETIAVIQDKYLQKDRLKEQNVAVIESLAIGLNATNQLKEIGSKLGYPFMLKSRTDAYDGRGNAVVKTEADHTQALAKLGKNPLYAEKWAQFQMELAVMIVKVDAEAARKDEEMWKRSTMAYPVTETVHEESICKLTYTPARNITETVAEKAQELARRAVAAFPGKGIFCVELFLLEDGKDLLYDFASIAILTSPTTGNLAVNEIAPRPHNSGHWTIEGTQISQFEAHLRAILDLPFPSPSPNTTAPGLSSEGLELRSPMTNAIMLNLLGGSHKDAHFDVCKKALAVGGATVHLYDKGQATKGRKMGHITLIAPSMTDAERKIQSLVDAVDGDRGVPFKAIPRQRTSLDSTSTTHKPLVAVTMGSDSDLATLKSGLEILEKFDIPFMVDVTSAHRTPRRMMEFAEEAAGKGIKVIIAAAGGAAHLPGMLAGSTCLPVIGVPVKASVLDGMDSLLSIVQMPRGVPVATQGIGNSTNAALLAIRILGTGNPAIQRKMVDYMHDMEVGVVKKASTLKEVGWKDYVYKA